MAKIKMEEAPEFEVFPPETVILVSVVSYEIKEFDGANGPWEKANFKFNVEKVFNPEFKSLEGTTMWGGVAFKFTDHPDNKLKQWVEALLGFEIEAGFELDLDDLVGRSAKAITGTYTKKGSNEERHTIESLIPADDAVTTPQTVGAGVGGGVTDDDVPF